MNLLSCMLLVLAAFIGAPAHALERSIAFGKFGNLTVLTPAGEPNAVVILLSSNGGWSSTESVLARALTAEHAVVLGIDLRRYLAALAKSKLACQLPGADLETLSHSLQKQLGLRAYHLPILVGNAAGATVAYATLAQAPIGTFAGALTVGFCADLDVGKVQLCPGLGLHYLANKNGSYTFKPAAQIRDPWILLQGRDDSSCAVPTVERFAAGVSTARVVAVANDWLPQFLTSYRQLSAHADPPVTVAPAVSDLPLTEVPATSGSSAMLTLLLTGDGGWAGLDQEVSAALARHGNPVIGFNTLKYFWQKRTPDEVAAAVARVLRHYLAVWHRERITMVGYSFGADVMPFVITRLPPDLRARISGVSFLGLSEYASFEVHVANWIPGIRSKDSAVLPELSKLKELKLLCIFGEGETDTLCPQLETQGISALRVGRGHHFSGNYDVIADAILRQQ